ncbi:LacI family DNA-binding transcriptional regulator [Amycolatopsis taiwanensis]|uniref:LacI family DNA-binding transcriptional regulator n=1 Tax=Amycolatopsis taiwanensis TaxID=342230 RepID=UPI0025575A23|nr:LacI family DNA-binding transcriptional regulator [Amycolatopsis taiwanensis]
MSRSRQAARTAQSPDEGPRGRVGIKDVARVAGVSPSTVSNVLNHPERVAPAKRAQVEQAMRTLGFVRNEAARYLRTGASRTLGLILLDAWNPFFTEMARGVEDYAFAQDWAVLVSNSDRRADRESRYLNVFAERPVDGIIIVPHGDPPERLADLRRQGIPSVLADRRGTGDTTMSVSLDDVGGGQLAVAHLLELGHRDIAFAGDPTRVTQVRDRLLGATRALAAAGRPTQFTVIETALTMGGGRQVGKQLVDQPPAARPSAVFASNDLVAIGLLQVLLRHGVRVPEDIAVIGYDDIEFASQLAVPLSSVKQPPYAMGHAAAELLIAALTGEPRSENHVVFQPELVVRESTVGTRG